MTKNKITQVPLESTEGSVDKIWIRPDRITDQITYHGSDQGSDYRKKKQSFKEKNPKKSNRLRDNNNNNNNQKNKSGKLKFVK